MPRQEVHYDRRDFLHCILGSALSATMANVWGQDIPFRTKPPRLDTANRKPLAVITTVYRPMSHAYHIAGRFILGYPLQGKLHVPQHYVHTLYVDQFPENDLSRGLAQEYGIRLCRTIEEALTLGTNKLVVDGILHIAEHGNYPTNEKGQILYPRYEWMEQIVKVFRKTGQVVPVFVDKHLSYSWEKAKRMYEWARELNIPLMAGSSLPVTWRRPELELPLNTPIETALLAAYGPIEVYGFHALEALQVMMERRQEGETGLAAVTCLTGEAVWQAGDQGLWSWELLEHALGRSETLNPGDIRRNVGTPVSGRPSIPPIAFLLEYRDGRRAAVLLLNGHIYDFCFAARITGQRKPASCLFYLPAPPGAKYFDALVFHIEKLLVHRKPSYPVERTLLSSGALDFLMESHFRKGQRIETPALDIRYSAPADSGFIRG
ncbi:MAG: hypothetical protein RMJ19_02430, partial [Gemmatales bacterium]|nr:hypothetical protein [Gemmatales bacterium]MDW8174504.1 hypothetical protein [Gemmatales bacterium]